MALDEATVKSPRKVWLDGERVELPDAVHKMGSFHHQGLAADLNLYVNGQWISNGSHPWWRAIGEKWESLDKLCVSGLRFRDPNHCSLGGEADRTEPLP